MDIVCVVNVFCIVDGLGWAKIDGSEVICIIDAIVLETVLHDKIVRVI